MDEWFVRATCQPFTVTACRYLSMAPTGWACQKLSSLRPLIDARVAEGSMNAVGDNCEGVDA